MIFKGQGGAFSQPGDSGSLIVSATGFNPVALLFAGNNSVTVGNPIDEVLAAFGVAIDGAGGPTPTTTTTTTTSTTTTSTTTSTTTTTVPAGEIVVVSISPNLVTSGSYSVPGRIDGLGFQPGLTVTFSGGNGPTPQAESPVVSEDRKVITFTLVMKDGGPPKPRVWTVTVQNPDGGFDTTSFTVDP